MDFSWIIFLDAVALVFIIEGILPFIRPEAFRKYLEAMQQQSDTFFRVMGLSCMLFGLFLLSIVRIFFDF